MLITDIEAQIRTRAGVSTAQYSEAQFLLDCNEAKDEFFSAMVAKLNTDRNWESWKVTTVVALQSEYVMPEVAADTAGTKMLENVAINYNGETYTDTGLLKYVKAKEVSVDSLQHEWNYYVENQSQDNPIYHISDNSYFIAPAFRASEVGTHRIKLTGIRKIADYTIATTEAAMKLPVDFQRLLIWACIPFALMAKRVDDNQVQKAQNDYEIKKVKALQNLSQRKEGPITMTYPEPLNDSDDIIITS